MDTEVAIVIETVDDVAEWPSSGCRSLRDVVQPIAVRPIPPHSSVVVAATVD